MNSARIQITVASDYAELVGDISNRLKLEAASALVASKYQEPRISRVTLGNVGLFDLEYAERRRQTPLEPLTLEPKLDLLALAERHRIATAGQCTGLCCKRSGVANKRINQSVVVVYCA